MKNLKYTSSSASCGTRHCSSHPTSSSRRPSHFLQQDVSQQKGLVVGALDPAFTQPSMLADGAVLSPSSLNPLLRQTNL